MADKRLDDALATVRKLALGIGGSTGYVQPGSDEAKAAEAFLYVIEHTVQNIQTIAEAAAKMSGPATEGTATQAPRHAGR